ncbi:hypothetical protein [Kitasatospora sp. MBT63]|uniref:Acg family FMN-binding oxidoreductase n=1 Tax=Kitasatospora sp. MBT63 TaxID=1444768 RepID=UPI00068ABFCC|nr:hypothetical protein [Kitasatospora sp. MBT63]
MSNPALTQADLRLLVSAAGAAPSLHNSQPWRFRPTADGTGIAVYADRRRAVPLADPDGAALHVSVGAAVFNLRVAAAARLGRAAHVRMLPDPADPDLLAVVTLAAPAAPAAVPSAAGDAPAGAAGLARLDAAIALRHSSREPFANRDVPESVLGELVAAAAAEGVVFAPLEEAAVRRVLELTDEAEHRLTADPDRLAETRGWLRARSGAADGIPLSALGPQDHDARVPMREFAGPPPYRPGEAPPARRFEALPQLCTLTTRGDTPPDWLRSGQALEHVWLLATLHGVRLTVLHQAVEWAGTRWALRDPEEGPGHVHAVLRLGYGPPGAATPRRPVEEILAPRPPAPVA